MAESKPIRILVMEDDAGLARLFQKKLERAAYDVDVARDGEEGLAMYAAGSYDVVAVDQKMSVHDGLEVIRIMASQGPLPTTIMVTGTGSEEIAVEAMKLGARDYLVKDADGAYLDLLPTVIERARRQQHAEDHMRLAAKVFGSAAEGILVTDAQAAIISVNKAFTEITDYVPDEVKGKNPRLLQSGRHDAEFYKQMWNSLTETGQWRGEIWNRRKDGDAYLEWLTISAVKNKRGQVTNYVGVFTDITSRKRAEERLRRLATHDPLTNLPNRELFEDRLGHAVALARRTRALSAVILLDLDHFKTINDTMGHAAGDRVLQAVAERLAACTRECDTVARLGGDEFTVVLGAISDPQHCAAVAQRILDELAKPLVLDGRELSVTASIGISLFPADGQDPESLLENADTAMYRAKETRNRYEFYTWPSSRSKVTADSRMNPTSE